MQQLDEINWAGRGHAAHKCVYKLDVSVMVITGYRVHSLCFPLQNEEGEENVFQPTRTENDWTETISLSPTWEQVIKPWTKRITQVYTGLWLIWTEMTEHTNKKSLSSHFYPLGFTRTGRSININKWTGSAMLETVQSEPSVSNMHSHRLRFCFRRMKDLWGQELQTKRHQVHSEALYSANELC